jgi:hypothetical protein
VARLLISPRTAEKIQSVHNLDPWAVYDALVCVRALTYVWDENPERGRRALVTIQVGGDRILAVLYPIADPFGDGFNLGSAYRYP